MKRILTVAATFACAFFLLSSFSIRENPQDPPRGKKKERHIKLEKTDDSGKTMKLDTIVEGDAVFVWNGDTIGEGKDLEWIAKDDFKLDSLFERFDIDEDDDGNIFILKSGKTKGSPMVYEFSSDDDSAKTYKIVTDGDNADDNVVMWHGKKGPDHVMVPPRPAKAPRVLDIMFMDKYKSDNNIDLSDPDIISFKKKEMSGDREKITIVRKKSDTKDVERNEEFIVKDAGDAAMFTPKTPVEVKTIKVIKKGGEDVQVIKDGEVLHLDSDENIKVIKKDGKIVRITENKKGNEKQVDVEVETETENN